MSVPVTPEAVIGWRAWHVDDRGGEPLLVSWSQNAAWPAGERMEARCRRHLLRAPHEAPEPGHKCGLYAVRTREQVEDLVLRVPFAAAPGVRRLPLAIGRVSLWGRVVENTRGWRAQYAYPYELTLVGGDERLAAALRGRYAVDVALG